MEFSEHFFVLIKTKKRKKNVSSVAQIVRWQGEGRVGSGGSGTGRFSVFCEVCIGWKRCE